MGVVYLWLMLDIIGNITTNVAKGLKEQIKLFGQKGLQEMYPTGESVEHMVLDYTSICNTVDQQKMMTQSMTSSRAYPSPPMSSL